MFEGEFPVFDIGGGQLQNLTDSHPTPGHQLKNQTIPGFDGTKDVLIHNFFFQNVPAGESGSSIELLQHRSVTGASEIRIEVFDDEVEEGGQLGVPGLLSYLFGSLIDFGQEREDFIRGYGAQLSFSKLGGEFRKDGLIGS